VAVEGRDMTNEEAGRGNVRVLPGAGRSKQEKIAVAEENNRRRTHAISTRFDPSIAAAERELEVVTGQWEDIYGQVNRYPRYSSPYFYWPFMVVLAICEVPVNRLSFELFFAESPAISIAVSLLVGTTLIALAHGIGTVTRRFSYNARSSGAWPSVLQLAVMLTLVGLLCYGVAVLRQGYLAFVTQPDTGFADLIESDQYGQAALLALRTTLGIEGYIFLFINLAIVMVGVLAAYFCHDPHPDYEKKDREKKRLEKAFKDLTARKAEAEASEERRYAAERRRIGA
jgi:signal transduction histidine kinase